MWKKFLCSSCIFLFAATPALASISINEFSPNSDPEWVELYNNGANSVDLTNWYLQDAANHKELLSGSISSNGFFVFEKAKGWLNNTDDTVFLYASDSAQPVDSVKYGSGGVVGNPDENKSAGRIPDGSGNWVNNLTSSKNASNPAPTATNTPGPTNTPTATPTNTPGPTAVPTATPRPSATPKVTAAPTPNMLAPTIGQQEFVNAQDNGQGSLLNLNDSPPPSETPAVLGSTDSKPDPIIPILIIGVGAIGLVVSLILLFVHSRKTAAQSDIFG